MSKHPFFHLLNSCNVYRHPTDVSTFAMIVRQLLENQFQTFSTAYIRIGVLHCSTTLHPCTYPDNLIAFPSALLLEHCPPKGYTKGIAIFLIPP